MSIATMAINQVNLRDIQKRTTRRTIVINLQGGADFMQSKAFISSLLDNRRLKMIKHITFSQDANVGTGSSKLKLELEVEGYYL